MNDVLKSVLTGNVLSSFLYNPSATYRYLENNNLISAFIEELLISDIHMKNNYQRKLYIVGIGTMFSCAEIPSVCKDNFSKLLGKMILMVGRLKIADDLREKRKRERKENHEEYFDLHSEDQAELEEDEIQVEEELKKYHDQSQIGMDDLLGIKVSDERLPGPSNEETKTEGHHHDHEGHDHGKGNCCDEDSCGDESFEEDPEFDATNDRMEINMVIDMLELEIKSLNEFDYFKNFVMKINKQDQEAFKLVINTLSEA